MAKPTQYTGTCTLADGTQIELKRGSHRVYTHAVVVEYYDRKFDQATLTARLDAIYRSGVRGKVYQARVDKAMVDCCTGEVGPREHAVLGFCGSRQLAEKAVRKWDRLHSVAVVAHHIVPLNAA